MLIFELKETKAVVIDNGTAVIKVRWLPTREGESDIFSFGIDAPRHIAVDREEIHQKKMRVEAVKKKKNMC